MRHVPNVGAAVAFQVAVDLAAFPVFAEAFPAPEWRRPWADGGIPKVRGDLPTTVHGGS